MRKLTCHDPLGTYLEDSQAYIVGSFGTTVPADALAGYDGGAIFHDTDSGAAYINVGSTTSSNFDQIVTVGATVSALTITTLTNTAMTRSAAAATDTYKAATAAALTVTDGTTSMLVMDTRTTSSGGGGFTLLGQPVSIASAGSALQAPTLKVAAKTATLTGTTTTTSLLGVGAYIDTQTITDASACTLSKASSLHVAALAAAGGSLTITASYMISTGVTDCFLTNAGVWTDTASTIAIKDDVGEATSAELFDVLDQIQPRKWKYKESAVGDDSDRQRYGIIAQELPECFRIPGPYAQGGLSGTILGSFGLAAAKALREENKDLKRRLETLERRFASN